jgi:hypothetical protein
MEQLSLNIQPLDQNLFVGEMTNRKLDVNKLKNECTQWGRNQDEVLMKKWLSQTIKTHGYNQ